MQFIYSLINEISRSFSQYFVSFIRYISISVLSLCLLTTTLHILPMTETDRDSKRVGSLSSPLPSSLPPPCECVQRYVRAEDWCVFVCACVCVCTQAGDCVSRWGNRSVGNRRHRLQNHDAYAFAHFNGEMRWFYLFCVLTAMELWNISVALSWETDEIEILELFHQGSSGDSFLLLRLVRSLSCSVFLSESIKMKAELDFQ